MLYEVITIECESEIEITGLNTLLESDKNQLTFLENKKYVKDLEKTNAAAVLVKEEFKDLVPKDTIALICEEPYVKLAYTSKLFAPNIIETLGNEPKIGP